MNRLKAFLTRLWMFISAKLGGCPKCMKSSIIGSAMGWSVLAIVYFVWPNQALLILSLLVAISFTLLMLSHVLAFIARVAPMLHEYQARHRSNRRQFIITLVKAGFAFAVAALFPLKTKLNFKPSFKFNFKPNLKLFGPSKAVLGIDIGFHSIKIVELKSIGKSYQITASAIARKPEAEGDEMLGDLIEGMLKEAKIHTIYAITSISRAMDERVIIKPIMIPNITADISKNELREAVKFEAVSQEYIPYNVEEAMIDCHVLGEKNIDGEKGLEVLLVAAPIEILETRAIAMISAGLMPIDIDIDFLALVRLLMYAGAVPEDQNVAIIDMGSSQTSIEFLQQGRLHIYPEIQVGSNEITAEISRSRQISQEEAEGIKYKEEFFKSEDQQIWSASDEIKDALESRDGLIAHIQNLFFAYESEAPDFKVNKVIFTGGGSQLINFDKYLQSQLQIPVERISYSAKIPLQAKSNKELPIQNNEASFTTAVGLSLKGRV